jgi:hypothetical protein
MVSPIQVMNRETGAYHDLSLRADRLVGFYDFVLQHRDPTIPPSIMPGINAAAATGLGAIFTYIPQKFPVESILYFLRDKQESYCDGYPNPTITLQEVEDALGRFGQTVRLLRGDGSEIE